METRLQAGTLYSGIGHAGLILWVMLGDWLFAPRDTLQIQATQVSFVTEAELAAMQSSSPTPSETPSDEPPAVEVAEPVSSEPPAAEPEPEAIPEPEPEVQPAPAPEPEPMPLPEPEAVPEPQPAPEAPAPEPLPEPEPLPPEPLPNDLAVAPEDQPLPSMSSSQRPKPRPADIVAPDPVAVPEDALTAETPEPAVSETPTETPQDPPQETTAETLPEETGDVLETEATEDQDEALGMTASIRPKSRPNRPAAAAEPAATPAEPAAEATAESEAVSDPAADAIAAAVAEAAAAEAAAAETGGSPSSTAGPPLNAGEIGNIASAIGKKWNVGSLSTDALSSIVVLRVEFSPDGKPGDITLVESSGPSQSGIQVAFEAARRAVQIAWRDGGIPLPADKYETWKVLEFVFDGNGMRLR
jgi:hypothetical protein